MRLSREREPVGAALFGCWLQRTTVERSTDSAVEGVAWSGDPRYSRLSPALARKVSATRVALLLAVSNGAAAQTSPLAQVSAQTTAVVPRRAGRGHRALPPQRAQVRGRGWARRAPSSRKRGGRGRRWRLDDVRLDQAQHVRLLNRRGAPKDLRRGGVGRRRTAGHPGERRTRCQCTRTPHSAATASTCASGSSGRIIVFWTASCSLFVLMYAHLGGQERRGGAPRWPRSISGTRSVVRRTHSSFVIWARVAEGWPMTRASAGETATICVVSAVLCPRARRAVWVCALGWMWGVVVVTTRSGCVLVFLGGRPAFSRAA